MKESHQAVVLFCEDVRFELGEKLSYMGIIGPDVWVRVGEELDFRCVFFTWAFEPETEVTIDASYELTGAPTDVRAPPPVTHEVRKNEGDDADRWLIQITSRLKLRVESQPVTLRAHFRLGKHTFTNRITFDPITPEAFKNIRG